MISPPSDLTTQDGLSVLWHALCQDTASRILVIAPDDRILEANLGSEEYFGMTRARMVGTPLPLIVSRQHEKFTRDWLVSTRAAVGTSGETHRYFIVARGRHWANHTHALSWNGTPGCLLILSQVVGTPTPVGELMRRCTLLPDRDTALGDLATLSDRELEVAMLVSSGLTDLEVANSLHRSLRTIHSHRNAVGRKLGLARRTEVAQLMISRGLVASVESHPARRSFFNVPNGLAMSLSSMVASPAAERIVSPALAG